MVACLKFANFNNFSVLIVYEIDSTGTGMELMERRKGNESAGLITYWELMSSVVFMLENETTELSVPKQPVYFSQRYSEVQETGENTSSSMNNMSMTVLLKGR
jgi:hypothetical protein